MVYPTIRDRLRAFSDLPDTPKARVLSPRVKQVFELVFELDGTLANP